MKARIWQRNAKHGVKSTKVATLKLRLTPRKTKETNLSFSPSGRRVKRKGSMGEMNFCPPACRTEGAVRVAMRERRGGAAGWDIPRAKRAAISLF